MDIIAKFDPSASSRSIITINPHDNVAVAVRDISQHSTIDDIAVRTNIPRGHKLALTDIPAGTPVLKYGQIIGYAKQNIVVGDHVHTHNVEFRNTHKDYEYCTAASPAPMVPEQERATFMGYRRPSGKVGTRNYIGILTTVNCSATVARAIAEHFTPEVLKQWPGVDGVVSFVHGTGCGMTAQSEGLDSLQRVIKGYAQHPNLAGVLLIGLGCEVNQTNALLKAQKLDRSDTFRTMTIQAEGGVRKTITQGIEAINEMAEIAAGYQREPCPVSELTLALQCGGSDAWSGITANPALGYAVDLLVSHGGSAILGETPEVYGAEHLLTRRAVDRNTADKLVERILWWENYTQMNGGTLDANPSPGNIQGGITTILEKSLGSVAKGGTTPLTGFWQYGETATRKGFSMMDSPGFDPVSVTGQVATGANIVAFTTGRGSCFGCKPSPSIKIASNSAMYEQMSEDMDINAGSIITEGRTIEEVGREIFDLLLGVASGELSLSEQNGLGDLEFVPWQIGAVM